MDKDRKAYIINLRFGAAKRELWLEGEDSPQGEENFNEATKGLTQVGNDCKEPGEFFEKAIVHFQEHGFMRIKK